MESPDVPFMHLRWRPVLDRLHVGDLFAYPDQRIERIGEFVLVLEHDHGQIGRIRDHLHMGNAHFRPALDAAHAHRCGRETEKRGGAVGLGHACDVRGDVAAIGIDAADQRHAVAHLVRGFVHHAGLFVQRAGMDFRRMAVHGYRRDAVDIGGERQVLPGLYPVEIIIGIECRQRRRNDPVGNVILEPRHGCVLSLGCFGGTALCRGRP